MLNWDQRRRGFLDASSSESDRLNRWWSMLRSGQFPETRVSLLASLRADEAPAGWRRFFEWYAPPVFRVARRRGLSASDADDIVQQVMLAICQTIADFAYDRDRGRFRHWVRTVTENKIRDFRRRATARGLTGDRQCLTDFPLEACIDERPRPDEIWDREWQMQDMLYCLDQVAQALSPRRRKIFQRCVLDGAAAAEVAGELGVTVGYIHVTKHHVLKIIQARMEGLDRPA